MGKIKNGKLLYHLTELDNLKSIIENGLCSRYEILKNNRCFYDIADSQIINKRKNFMLDKYVPFHFHPYSAFDVAVKNTHTNKEFIYVCVLRDFAKNNNFLILPRHPLSGCYKLFSYIQGFEEIDWDVMEKTQEKPGYDKMVRMAECLSDKPILAKDIYCIYAKNENIKNHIKNLEKSYSINIPIYISPWF